MGEKGGPGTGGKKKRGPVGIKKGGGKKKQKGGLEGRKKQGARREKVQNYLVGTGSKTGLPQRDGSQKKNHWKKETIPLGSQNKQALEVWTCQGEKKRHCAKKRAKETPPRAKKKRGGLILCRHLGKKMGKVVRLEGG